MRIALFVHCYYPEHYFGTESYTRLVARTLRDRGHEPVVVTATFAGEPVQTEAIQHYRIDDIPVLRLDKNRMPHTSLAETYAQQGMAPLLTDLLREIAPDIVHVTHLINHTATLLEVCARLSIPAFATFTDFFGFCFNNKLEAADGGLCAGPDAARANCIACLMKDSPAPTRIRHWLQGPKARPLLSRVLSMRPELAGREAQTLRDVQRRPRHLAQAYRTYRAAIAPSAFLRDAYRANGFENLVLSRFGIEIDRSAKPPAPAPEGLVRFGYIGQIAPHKGIHLLLDALRRLAPASAQLDIFGSESQDPTYAAGLRTRAADLPVAFRGTFAAEAIADVLAGLDVVVIPSTWYENSPLILLQALATHTPVVIADVSGMTEFVRHGENGFVFRRGDTADLALALGKFLQDRTLARRMSAGTAYDRTPQDMIDDMLDMYAGHGVEGAL